LFKERAMCGVIGVLTGDGSDAFHDIVNGLYQMQHRGQDACGISISDGERIHTHRGIGYVREVFAARPGPEFRGGIGCGHDRYPTQGANRLANAQPHAVATLAGVEMALASNGDLTNYHGIRAQLERDGMGFSGANDGELLVNFVAYHHLKRGRTIEEAIRVLQAEVRGAYSACLITRDALYAFRDPFGVRPLAFGLGPGGWMVASETNALDIAGVDHVDDVQPGEIIRFTREGAERLPHPDPVAARGGRADPAHCVFEYVYFSRPDSITYGQRVYDVRKRIGAWLARHDNVEADVVVAVPDSANAVALGYAHASGLPLEFGLVRNHYVGRTFISPDQPRRDEGVRMKFNPLRSVFRDRRVVLVDDSIVRGTTSRKLVRMVRQAGAAEVHVRIGSPVTRHSCFYGIDTPDDNELIGNLLSVDEIRDHLTADSVLYMTTEGLRECSAVPDGRDTLCMACFDGRYPIPITEHKDRPVSTRIQAREPVVA
jgi:amidophosphoribosyltransferase